MAGEDGQTPEVWDLRRPTWSEGCGSAPGGKKCKNRMSRAGKMSSKVRRLIQ